MAAHCKVQGTTLPR